MAKRQLRRTRDVRGKARTSFSPRVQKTWVPVIGGEGGESGQVYLYQTGTYRIAGRVMHLWGYVQFHALGTINGNLVLRGLPAPTALIPHPVGGVSTYFSNVHPNSPVQMWFRANGGMNYFWIDGQPLRGSNPVPMTANDLNPASQIIFNICYPLD